MPKRGSEAFANFTTGKHTGNSRTKQIYTHSPASSSKRGEVLTRSKTTLDCKRGSCLLNCQGTEEVFCL
ncbi:hypothetical protein Celaphus_00008530 [Cervus elaphus hippelaphus]|uniref:Uncharacterized protein n=1 Tax=Cervus elaphus hippelaphus TaxID=46360 RepID=A0A212CPS4_CEREH|nr:hypothetical protein Celaphus_00008530 [Cervus elaphus hippelaphus]